MAIPLGSIRPYGADRSVPSPNHGDRGGAAIRLVVLHATAGSDIGAESWLANPASGVSAHLHIRRDGSVTRQVSDTRRAWHAGASAWPEIRDVNSESLGWEIGNRNDGEEEFTPAQYKAVARLLAHYLPQGLKRRDVVGHYHVSPGRKTDPLGWDWSRMWAEVNALMDLEPVSIELPEPQRVESMPERVTLPGGPPKLPDHTYALMGEPIDEVVWYYAAEGETTESFLCRLMESVLSSPDTAWRIPAWFPVAMARWLFRQVLRCDPHEEAR